MPPKGSGQSPGGGWQVAGSKRSRGRRATSEPAEDRRTSSGSRSRSSRPGAPEATPPAQAASPVA
eukprot:1629259-Alexandrium_andersonii.AAC.1